MAQSDLYEGLAGTGYPVVYHHWKSAPALPYIVYLSAPADDFMADNKNYVTISDWRVELYSANKDPTAEAAVEEALASMGLPYRKDGDTYLDTEEMFMTLYTVRTIASEPVS